MKRRTRVLSLLLAIVLVATLLPIDQLGLIPAAKASDYNPTIDFKYAENNHVTTATDALRVAGEEIYTERSDHDGQSPAIDENYYKSNYNKFRWKHCDKWALSAGRDETSINTLLESTDDADTYIALTTDDVGSYSNTKQEWHTIKVTKNKVLDLNGHKFRISYDRNVHQGTNNYQMTNEEFNKCTFLEIEQGATLTIIDSSAWRGENGGQGTGELSFTAYMIAPYLYDIEVYTTRDLFWVNNGNLVIYGGTFQAGRKKDQLNSKFSWDKFTTVIGQTVELGVAIAEYASGISVATSKYQDLLKQQMNMSALEEKGDTGPDDGTEGTTQTMVPRLGESDDDKVAKENKQDTPQKPGGEGASTGRDQTVDEKKNSKNDSIDKGQPGTKEDKNKENKKGTGKDDSKTSVVEAQKNIATQALDKKKVTGMVDNAISLVKGIAGMIGTDPKSRVTQSIKGTVVHVGNNGAFVAYGGTFKGYGSTPNTRNAVIEVNVVPQTSKTFDYSKNQGGLAYIYDGTFEAYNGANVFNMIRYNKVQYAMQYTADKYGNKTGPTRVPLEVSETNGVEVLYYDNQEAVAADAQGEVEPIPVNTSNVQVRGGVFRCFYDIMNVAVKGDSNEHFTKFPGTMGTVNLGIGSFNEDLIYDGRIQISDKYGDGALVLLDERKDETADTNDAEGLIHYRLFCGDNELRYKSYLEVYPNTARTNTSHSMQLATYEGSGKKTSSLWTNDKEGENVRSPYCMTENYFDYMYDSDTASSWSIMPNFHFQASKENPQEKIDSLSADVYGKLLDSSEVWYYPTPRAADGAIIKDVAYGEATASFVSVGESKLVEMSQKNGSDEVWKFVLDHYALPGSVSYWAYEKQAIRTNLRYFTYRIYRVDPLTRENISESDSYGVDVPLITVRYGASVSGTVNEALKCKLPLKTLEREIKDQHPFWKGYQSGEMYRVVLDVEEYVAIDYQGRGVYGQKLNKACSQSSILFRCFSEKEQKNTGGYYKAHDFTPVQWKDVTKRGDSVTVKPGSTVTVDFVNAKAGMTDYKCDTKVFDVYYQWWEVEADGTPIRMIAGTDNLYDPANGSYGDHRKESWNVGNDGKHYFNTVDPGDPKASTYTYYGLPGKPDGSPDNSNWKDYQLHAYIAGTTRKEDLTPDGTDNLALDNNKIFATGMDSCYIPKDMAGKYLQVKAIVQNVRWPLAYDSLQTFRSHVIRVAGGSSGGDTMYYRLAGELALSYSGAKDYAGSQSPVTFRLENVHGLSRDDKITSVYFVAWASRKEGSTVSKEFTGLSLREGDTLPTARFPNDFYPTGYNYAKLDAGEYCVEAQYKTSDGRTCSMRAIPFNYQVEATGILRVGAEYEQIDKSDIVRGGKYENGKKVFEVMPSNATTGFSFSSAISSNPSVATVDDRGYVHFTGTQGTAVVSCTGPDGKTASATFEVCNNYKNFTIKGISAPVIGEKFDQTADGSGRGANYTIKEVKWYQRIGPRAYEELGPDAVAELYKNYFVRVTVQSKNGCTASEETASYKMTVDLADGSSKTVSGKMKTSPDAWQEYDYDKNEYSQRFTFSYSFDAESDHDPKTISKIYMDFPTEVAEGTNFDEWLSQVHIYTDGYDDGLEFDIQPSYGPDSNEIAGAYGTSISSNGNFRTFIQGFQTGLAAHVTIPEDLVALGDKFGSGVKLYVNGAEGGKITAVYDNQIWFTAQDSLTVTEGEPAPARPAYAIDDVCAVVGQTIRLSDLLRSDDWRFSTRMTEVRCDQTNSEQYFSYDLDEGTFTPKKEMNTFNSVYVYYDVIYDADNDGQPEYIDNKSLNIDRIYASVSEAPALQNVKTLQVTLLDPEENESYSGSFQAIGTSMNLSLPEVDDAFIVGLYTADGVSKADLRYGASRIYGAFADGTSYTGTTVDVDNMEVHPGADFVNAFIKDSDGRDVQGINISVDGVHYTCGDRIMGLSPNTEYVLYYKQGIDGTVYVKQFRTADQTYNVFVGREPVTDANLGNLEHDGWHYEPETKTLTIQDLNLVDTGAISDVSQFYAYSLPGRATIYSADDLTVKLVGDNYLGCFSSGITNTAICAEKNLYITGNGNLAIAKGTSATGFMSNKASIYLRGTGTISIEGGFGFTTYNGKTYYENGTIDFQPKIENNDGYIYPSGTLVPYTEADSFVVSNPVHQTTINVGKLDGSYRTISASEIETVINTNYHANKENIEIAFRFEPIHSDVKKVTAADYLKSGSCTEPCTYYFSCACGHVGSNTFNVAASEHDYETFAANPATCVYGGWNEYKVCTKCGYSTFQELLPLGHDWVHYEQKEPTCTEGGYPAYDVCTRCGLSSRLDVPVSTTIKTRGVTPKTGQKDNDNEYRLWLATGHDYVPVAGTAPTCTAGGTAAHYRCVHCGEISLDETGTNVVTESNLALDAIGHAWSPWEPTEEASEVMSRFCLRCGEVETRSAGGPTADKTALDSAVEAAEKVDKSRYTPESVAALEAAVAAAQALQADPAATQAEVDAAAQAVSDAIAGLVRSDGGPENPFVDVKTGAFYYEPVLWAVAHDPQITKGTDATHFSPDATCTRGQVVTFLWRAKGCPEPTKTDNPFTDVKEGAFYYKAVLWAVENGVTNGVDATHFGPNQGCTRGQVVTFLWRAEGQPAPASDANPFADVTGGFYYDAVLWAVEKDITKGTDATHFSPGKTCTRGQIVTFLYRDMK